MNSENATNKTASDTTSASRAGRTGLTESQYLAIEARAAKSAVNNTLIAMKRDLAETVDPRVWAKAHPLIAVAAALAGGFATAATLIPSKEQQARRDEEAARQAKRRAKEVPPVRVHIVDDDAADRTGKKHSPTLLGAAAKTVFQIAKPIVMSAISAALAAQTAQNSAEESNGHS